MTVHPRHVPPLYVTVGERFELGGVLFRVTRTSP